MHEKQVKNAVCEYFGEPLFSDFSFHTDERANLCAIHFGRIGTADVVLCDSEGYFVAIAECKSSSIGITEAGREQLKSYLNSKNTFWYTRCQCK